MMSIALALTAVELATKFAPQIIGLFSKEKGERAGATAKVVNSIAEKLTGKSGDEAVKALSADPHLALEFKKLVMTDSHIESQMAHANTDSARDMYKEQQRLADYVGKKVIDQNLIYIAGLVTLYISFSFAVPLCFPESVSIVAGIVGTVGPLVGGIIHQLSKERSDVINFLFGSSLGSKIKDQLKNLGKD